jgi:hypothetical protein
MVLRLVTNNEPSTESKNKYIKHKYQKISFLIILLCIVVGSFVYSSILTSNLFLSILIAVISAIGFSSLALPAFILYNVMFTENYQQPCDPH